MRVATIKILNEINVVLIGLTQEDYKFFWDKFGLFANGYNFKPAYKLGQWDGKTRLFSKTGVTSIHFLPEILPELKKLGYKVKLIDKRNPVTFELPLVDAHTFEDEFGIVLGDHQVVAINSLIENRGQIAIAATGAGKSFVIGALFKLIYDNAKLRCLTIVPTTDLVTQTADEIALFGNNVGMYYGKKKELDKTHLVSTWQSLQNNPSILHGYNAIIIDEAHGAKSNVLKRLILDYGSHAVFIAGVTGTLPKHKAELAEVTYVLGNVISKVEGRALINLGWLAKLKIERFILEEDFRDKWDEWRKLNPEEAKSYTYRTFKSSYFPDYASESSWIKTNKTRNLFISELITTATESTGNSFILVNGIAFGKRLAKLIPNSIFVHGADETEVRKQIYDLYATNDGVIVISTFKLASTGLNIKRIFNLFLIDPGKSFIQIIQSIGRGLRKAEDKDAVTVWDISSDLKYSRRHCNERKKYYIEQSYKSAETKINYSAIIHPSTALGLDTADDVVVY